MTGEGIVLAEWETHFWDSTRQNHGPWSPHLDQLRQGVTRPTRALSWRSRDPYANAISDGGGFEYDKSDSESSGRGTLSRGLYALRNHQRLPTNTQVEPGQPAAQELGGQGRRPTASSA